MAMSEKLIYEQHPVDLPQRANGTLVYTFAPADSGESPLASNGEDDEAHWRWKMLPSLAHALRELGLVED